MHVLTGSCKADEMATSDDNGTVPYAKRSRKDRTKVYVHRYVHTCSNMITRETISVVRILPAPTLSTKDNLTSPKTHKRAKHKQ